MKTGTKQVLDRARALILALEGLDPAEAREARREVLRMQYNAAEAGRVVQAKAIYHAIYVVLHQMVVANDGYPEADRGSRNEVPQITEMNKSLKAVIEALEKVITEGPTTVLAEFVDDVKAAHGTGYMDVIDEEALDWPDLMLTYKKAVAVLNLNPK